MTPTEQDKELREKINSLFESVFSQGFRAGKDVAAETYEDFDAWRKGDEIDEIMQLITADRKRVALEIKNKGHWYAGTYGKDNNGFAIGHMCSCGVRYVSRESIDGHITWKLAELKAQQEEV